MGEALWHSFYYLPQWYFYSSIFGPFASPWSIVPSSGAVALLLGTVLAVTRREFRAFWVFVPVVLAHICLALSSVFQNRFEWAASLFWPSILALLAFSIVVAVFSKRSHTAGLLLGWFTFTYGSHASFLSALHLTRDYV